jgi:beta-ureidopropionase / N-carbamoyl-L-amino-acid hydrolase
MDAEGSELVAESFRPQRDSFGELWESLLPVGRDPRTGGYRRFAWSAADREAREWFRRAAAARGMPVEADRNGNLWAWWGEPRPGSVVTGSHLDSVPDGGPFDGPLGIVSAFCAVDLIRSGKVNKPQRSVAVVCFADEEGARFGVACVGSRLLTGALEPDRARGLRDADGTTLADAMRSAGHDPRRLGRDDEALAWIGAFVELHIEQGRALAGLGSPIAVAEGIRPHGRWRFDFPGRADHAGTTRLADRDDPMLAFAQSVLDARTLAEQLGALATFGRVVVEPNGTNAIPSRVRAWLDARAPDEGTVGKLVAALSATSGAVLDRESWSPTVRFDQRLTARLADVAGQALRVPRTELVEEPPISNLLEEGSLPLGKRAEHHGGSRGQESPVLQSHEVPMLATGAGHDAGVLASEVPAAMLFVRNPTGVSHSPAEHADRADCLAGVVALAAVLDDLTTRSGHDRAGPAGA